MAKAVLLSSGNPAEMTFLQKLLLNLNLFKDPHSVVNLKLSKFEEIDSLDKIAESIGSQHFANLDTKEEIVVIGYSSGGLLAHALGDNLRKRGYSNAFVIMLDTPGNPLIAADGPWLVPSARPAASALFLGWALPLRSPLLYYLYASKSWSLRARLALL